jgi:hypothetical protein
MHPAIKSNAGRPIAHACIAGISRRHYRAALQGGVSGARFRSAFSGRVFGAPFPSWFSNFAFDKCLGCAAGSTASFVSATTAPFRLARWLPAARTPTTLTRYA